MSHKITVNQLICSLILASIGAITSFNYLQSIKISLILSVLQFHSTILLFHVLSVVYYIYFILLILFLSLAKIYVLIHNLFSMMQLNWRRTIQHPAFVKRL